MTNIPISTADPLLIEAEKNLYSSLVPPNPTKEEIIVGAIALSTYWRSKHTHAEKHFQEYGNQIDARALRVQLSALNDPEQCKTLKSNSRIYLEGYLKESSNQQLVDSMEKIVKKNTNPWFTGWVNIVSTFIFSLIALAFLCTPFADNLKDAYKVLIKEAAIVKPSTPQNK